MVTSVCAKLGLPETSQFAVIRSLSQSSYLLLKHFHWLFLSNAKIEAQITPLGADCIATLPERMKNDTNRVKHLKYGPTEQC